MNHYRLVSKKGETLEKIYNDKILVENYLEPKSGHYCVWVDFKNVFSKCGKGDLWFMNLPIANAMESLYERI